MDNAMKYLWAEWNKLNALLASKKEKLLLLDFDGTLLPIASHPSAVRLHPETKRIVKRLSQMPNYRVVFLSGRPLKDLRHYLGLKGVLYAANHGLEVKGWGLSLPENAKKARKLKGLIHLLAKKFENAFGNCYDGLLIEDKKYTLSLHYRNLPKDQQVLFDQQVHFFKDKYKKYPLTWIHGKKVWEVRPSIFWGKRDMAFYLAKKFPKALPLAIGDDRADEGMFQAFKKRGITIRVGRLKRSRAAYYLKSPYEVRTFLRRLCG